MFRVASLAGSLKESFFTPFLVNFQRSTGTRKSFIVSAPHQEKMNLNIVVQKLNNFAPTKLGASWDNIGLLVEPPSLSKVSTILLTNDLTLDVMSEAEEKKIDLILSYHPPLFQALKKITLGPWKQRIVATCLARGIAIYSPHTAHDALQGGVNDWLISVFGGVSTPIEQTYLESNFSHCTSVSRQSDSHVANLQQRLDKLSQEDCDLRVHQNGNNLKVFSASSAIPNVIKEIQDIQPELASECISITKNEKVPMIGYGMGRTSILDTPITLMTAVDKVKTHTGLQHLRVAVKQGGTLDSMVKSVSVCAGAGSSVLANVKSDLLLTGEMSHHQVLDFAQQGQNVILVEHSNSERGYLKELQKKLTYLFENKIEVILSQKDKDPLEIV